MGSPPPTRYHLVGQLTSGNRTSLDTSQVTISADRTLLKINISGRIREAAKIGLATLEHLASAEDLGNIAVTADDLRDTQVCQRSKITLSNISRRWEL